jgi:hypothetical protein
MPKMRKLKGNYSRIISTKSPASGAGNVSEPRLMSQVGRVREVVCLSIGVFLQLEHLLTLQLRSCDGDRRAVRVGRLTLYVVKQNDWGFVDVIVLLYVGG